MADHPLGTSAARRPRAVALIVVAAAIVIAAAIVVSTHDAIEVDEDSVSYLVGAESIVAGNGYRNFDGRALTTWPPGLSVVLAAGSELGIAATTTAMFVNALCAIAASLLAYVLVRRHVRNSWLPVIACVVVATSPVVIRVSDVVASEPLFIALTLVFLVVHENAVASGRWTTIAASATVATAATYVRWHGLALVASGLIVLAFAESAHSRRRVPRVLTFGAVVTALLLPWVGRNLVEGGRAFGMRSTTSSAMDVATSVGQAVGHAILPERLPVALLRLTTILVFAVAAIGAFTWFRAMPPAADAAPDGATGARRPTGESATHPDPSGVHPITTVAVSTLCLFTFAVAARLTGGTDLTLRTLSPDFVPALVLGFAWFDRARASSSNAIRVTATTIGMVFAVWAILTVPRAVLLVRDNERTIDGYSSPAWRASPLVAVVDELSPSTVVFTNAPWPIWYRDHARRPLLAAREVGGLAQPIATRNELWAASCRGGAYLAVFGADVRPRDVLPPGSTSATRLTVAQHVEDGTLFTLDPVEPSSCRST